MAEEHSPPPSTGPFSYLCAFALATLFGLVLIPWLAKACFVELMECQEYRFWLVLVVLQATIWILSARYGTLAWRRLPLETKRTPGLGQLATASLLMALLIAAPVFPNLFLDPAFPRKESRATPVLPLPLLLGTLTSLWAAMGIFRVHIIARSWISNSGTIPPEQDYHEANRQLEHLLLLLGAVVAGGVIGTQASREAFYAIDKKHFLLEGEAWFLAIYWSALLAVIYLGPRSALNQIGSRILAKKMDQFCPHESDLTERFEFSKSLKESLGLERGFVAQLQSTFGIVTPIAGAIASQLLP